MRSRRPPDVVVAHMRRRRESGAEVIALIHWASRLFPVADFDIAQPGIEGLVCRNSVGAPELEHWHSPKTIAGKISSDALHPSVMGMLSSRPSMNSIHKDRLILAAARAPAEEFHIAPV